MLRVVVPSVQVMLDSFLPMPIFDSIQILPKRMVRSRTQLSLMWFGIKQLVALQGLTSVATTGDTTAYSVNSETASITVSSLNDAPVVASVTNFTTITEDDNQGSTPVSYAQISSLIAVTDVDTSAPNDGIAIVGQTTTHGVWKYSLDALTWGTVSISSGALVLDLDDYIAFIPDGENGETQVLSFMRGISSRIPPHQVPEAIHQLQRQVEQRLSLQRPVLLIS